MAFSVSYIYKLVDRFSRPSKKIQDNLDSLKRKFRKAGAAAKKNFAGGVNKANKSLKGFATSTLTGIVGIGALAVGLTGAIKSASNFADAMSDVDKVMDLTQKGTFNKFRKTILDLAPKLATMPEDLAKMAYQGAKVEVAEKDMSKFLTVVSKVKNAFDMTAESAGSAVGSIKARLGLTIGETEKMMSKLNFMADTTRADGERMLDIIARVSGDFKLMKFDTTQIAAFAAAADQIETSSELAASGLRMAFNRLQQSPIYQRKFQEKPVKTFLAILDSLKKMEPVARNIKIKKLFGDEAGKFIKKAVSDVGKFRKALKGAASDAALKSMDKEWAMFVKRSSTGFTQIKIKLMKLVIKVGEVFLKWFDRNRKTINSIVDAFSNWIAKNEELIPRIVFAVTILTALVGIIILLGVVFASLSVIMGAFGITSMAALLPIMIVIGAIILVVYGLYKAFQFFTGKSSKTVDGLTDSVKKLNAAQNQKYGGMYVGKGVNNAYKMEMMKKQETNITGQIGVKAEPGSTVTKKNITANQGSNTDVMAYDFGHH